MEAYVVRDTRARRRGGNVPRQRPVAPEVTCRFCAGPPGGEMVDAGGDVGRAHRACFVDWDRRQEALEAEIGRDLLGDPRIAAAEFESETTTIARAA